MGYKRKIKIEQFHKAIDIKSDKISYVSESESVNCNIVMRD